MDIKETPETTLKDIFDEIRAKDNDVAAKLAKMDELEGKFNLVMKEITSLKQAPRDTEFYGDKDVAINSIKHVRVRPLTGTSIPTTYGFVVCDKEVAKKLDDLVLLAGILNRPVTRLHSYQEDTELRKAMTTTGSGTGAEWVPTGFSTELTELVRLELKVAALFPHINMPTNPFKLPSLTAGFAAKLSGELGTQTKQSLGTGNKQLTAKKLIVVGSTSEEEEEDSIIAVLPLIRAELVTGLADGIENGILNGDVSGTHQDSDTTAADDVRKAFSGLRYRALAVNAVDGATFDEIKIRAIREAMGKYGVLPTKVAYIAGFRAYYAMMSWTNALTYDKIRDRATLLTGQLGEFDGSGIIVSEHARQDLNASGVYDGTTTTKATLTAVKIGPGGYLIGDRRLVQVETDRNIETQEDIVVGSQRTAFDTAYADTEKLLGIVYNIG